MNASKDQQSILAELMTIRHQLDRIEVRLNEVLEERKPKPVDDLLTTAQFAKQTNRSVDFIYDEIKRGEIKTLRGKRPYLIPRSELLRYLDVTS
jgi:excisionase family DNA binding protein